MPSIVTNFKFKSSSPNFERDQVKKINDLKIAGMNDYDIGHIVYCMENNKHYAFGINRSPINSTLIYDNITGYFSELKTGVGDGSGSTGSGEGVRVQIAYKRSKLDHTATSEQIVELGLPEGWSWDAKNDVITHGNPSGIDNNGWAIDDSKLERNDEDGNPLQLWQSVGVFYLNEPSVGHWGTPYCLSARPGEDGSTIEFIYARTKDETTKPYLPSGYENDEEYQNPDFFPTYSSGDVPEGMVTGADSEGNPRYWFDNPQGISLDYQCEWFCQRFRKDGAWGPFSEPVLWAKWGVVGRDGDGLEYIYNKCGANDVPPLPKFCSDKDFDEGITVKVVDQKGNFIDVDYQADEYVPNGEFKYIKPNGDEETEAITGWLDEPGGVSIDEPWEFVSIRKFNRNTGTWGKFSKPVLWAHYSRQGFRSYVFTKSKSKPATPVDNNKESFKVSYGSTEITIGKTTTSHPIPVDPGIDPKNPQWKSPDQHAIWYDGIPDNDNPFDDNGASNGKITAPLYMSWKDFFIGEKGEESTGWSEPAIMKDSNDMLVEYNNSDTFPEDPIGNYDDDGIDGNGWYDPYDPKSISKNDWTEEKRRDYVDNAIWMAMLKLNNGTPIGEWTIVKIKGEDGEDGTSINIKGTYDTYEALETARINTISVNDTMIEPAVSGGFKSYDDTKYEGYTDQTTDDNIKQYNPKMGDTYLIKNVNVMVKDGTWVAIDTSEIHYENSKGIASYDPYTILKDGIEDFNNGKGETEHITLFTNGAFTWDGDSWVFVGRIAGESNYVHIKYSDNPGVLDKNAKDKEAINNSLKDFPTDDNMICKYMGICVHEDINPPLNVKDSDGNVTKYAYEFYKWSKFAGEDGFGYEYIYMRSRGNNPENPVLPILPDNKKPEDYDNHYQTPEYVPGETEKEVIYKETVDNGDKSGTKYTWWTDEQQGVSEEFPYEWMTWRKYSKENGEWGEWKGNSDGTAFLQNVWNGMEFTSFVFTRLKYDIDLTEAKVEGGTFSNPIPTFTTYKDKENNPVDVNHVEDPKAWQWHDSVPTNGAGNIWMTQARFNIGMDGMGDSKPTWTNPVIMNDTTEQDVDWCPNDVSDPGTPDNPATGVQWFENVYTDTDAEGGTDTEQKWPVNDKTGEKLPAIWMATRPLKNGVAAGAWVITRIHGEKGDKGDPGTSINIKGRYNTWDLFMAAWLGPDGQTPGGYPFGGVYNGTLTGGEPRESHAYLIENRDDQPHGHVYTYVPSAYDGEDMESVWVDCGKFTGENGLTSYTHIKYSDNPDVMDSSITNTIKLEAIKNSLNKSPIGTDDEGNTIIRKYMGIYSDNTKDDSPDYKLYKWSKFVGEDGLGYEYIYTLTGDNSVPELPKFCSGAVLPEGTTVQIKSENGSLAEVNYQENDFLPNGEFVYTDADGNVTDGETIGGWTDGQTGVSDSANSQFEWMSCRIKKTWDNGRYEWGPFSTPVISSHWGTQQYSTIESLHITPSVVKVKNGATDPIKVEIMTVTGNEKSIQDVPKGYTVKAKFNNNGTESEYKFEQTVKDGDVPPITITGLDLSTNPNTLQIELYDPSDGNSVVGDLIDSETLPVLYDGDSNLQINLTNDSYYLKCNAYGDPINNGETATTAVELYYGLDKLTIGDKVIEDGKETNKYKLNLGETEVGVCEIGIKENDLFTGQGKVEHNENTPDSFTFKGFDANHPISLTFTIEVKATIKGKDLSKTVNFVVNKIQPGGDAPSVYTLIPSTKSIINNNGTNTPASVCISKVYKQVYGEGGQIKLESVDNGTLGKAGLVLKYYKDGATTPEKVDVDEEVYKISSSIEFRLVKENTDDDASDDITVADVYIPVLKNGEDGQPAEFKRMTSSTSMIKRFKNADGNYAYTPTVFTLTPQTITGNSISDSWDIGTDLVALKDNTGSSIYTRRMPAGVNTIPVELTADKLNGAQYITITAYKVGTYDIIDTLTIPILSDGESGEITDVYSLQCSSDVIKVDKDGGYTPKNMTPLALLRKGSDVDVLQTSLKRDDKGNLMNPGYQIWFILKKAAGDYYALSNYQSTTGSDLYYVALSNKIDSNTYLKYNINKLVNNLELVENTEGTTKRDVPGFFGRDESDIPYGINMPSTGEYAIATGIDSRNNPTIDSNPEIKTIQDSQSLEVYLIYEPNTGDPKILDHESIPILKDGAHGEDAYTVNLSNDLIAISCDASGKPHSTDPYTSTISVYKGINHTNITLNDIAVTADGYLLNTTKKPINGMYLSITTGLTINVEPVSVNNLIATTDVEVVFTIPGSNTTITKTLKVIAVKDGQQGESKSGKIPYYAGEYNGGIYTQTPTATPYVFYNDGSDNTKHGYYLLISDSSEGNVPTNPAYWLKMTEFEAIYSKVGVIKQALVGGAVFDKDWMYSQECVKYKWNKDTSACVQCRYNFNEDGSGNLGPYYSSVGPVGETRHGQFILNIPFYYLGNSHAETDGYYMSLPDVLTSGRPTNLKLVQYKNSIEAFDDYEFYAIPGQAYYTAGCFYQKTTTRATATNLSDGNNAGKYVALIKNDNNNNVAFAECGCISVMNPSYSNTGGSLHSVTVGGYTYTSDGFIYDCNDSPAYVWNKRENSDGDSVYDVWINDNTKEGYIGIRVRTDGPPSSYTDTGIGAPYCSCTDTSEKNRKFSTNKSYTQILFNTQYVSFFQWYLSISDMGSAYANYNHKEPGHFVHGDVCPKWGVNLKTGASWSAGGLTKNNVDGSGWTAGGKYLWDSNGNSFVSPIGNLSIFNNGDANNPSYMYNIVVDNVNKYDTYLNSNMLLLAGLKSDGRLHSINGDCIYVNRFCNELISNNKINISGYLDQNLVSEDVKSVALLYNNVILDKVDTSSLFTKSTSYIQVAVSWANSSNYDYETDKVYFNGFKQFLTKNSSDYSSEFSIELSGLPTAVIEGGPALPVTINSRGGGGATGITLDIYAPTEFAGKNINITVPVSLWCNNIIMVTGNTPQPSQTTPSIKLYATDSDTVVPTSKYGAPINGTGNNFTYMASHKQGDIQITEVIGGDTTGYQPIQKYVYIYQGK